MSVFMISPSVAYAFTASRMWGIRLSDPAAALRSPFSAAVHRAWSRLARTARTRATCSASSFGSMRRISIGASSSTVNSLTPIMIRRFSSRSRCERGAGDVELGLLGGQRHAGGLCVEAQLPRPLVLRAVLLTHPARPDAASRAELGDLLEEVDVRVEEERKP